MIATLDLINHATGISLAAILNTAMFALATAALAWAALRFIPRVNAATRHAAWWAVLALVVIIPSLPRSASPKSVAPSRQIRSAAAESTLSNPHRSTAVQDRSNASSWDSAAMSSRPTSQLQIDRSKFSASQAPPPSRIALPIQFQVGKWTAIIFSIWFSVFLLLMARVVSSYVHLRNVRSRALDVEGDTARLFEKCLLQSRMSVQPKLLASSEIYSPLASGFLHPVVILPAQLLSEISEPELEAVFLHELAHFARGDNWTNLLARLAAPALILHPMAAWALVRIEREREIACDDWAVSISGSARQYAATLARLFEICGSRRRELLATGMAHRSSRLGERIEMLLRPKRKFAARTSALGLALCTAVGLAILAAGIQSPRWVVLAQDSPALPQVVVTAKRPVLPTQSVGQNSPVMPTSAVSATSAVLPALPAQPTASSLVSNRITVDFPGAPQQLDRMSGPGWTPEWTIERSHNRSDDKVRLSFGFRRGGTQWIEESDVPLSTLHDFSLSMLDQSGPIKFEYIRAAGELICEGKSAGGHASGTFTVNSNPEFVSALAKMGYPTPDENDVVSMMMSDVTLEFARDVKATGLELRAGDLGELRSHGVTANYIKQAREAGLTKLNTEDFCDLRTHGVEPEYLKRILAVDPKLTAEEISDLRTHGVEPEYYKDVKATGIALSIEDITSLRTHGAEASYIKRIHEANAKLSTDEIDELRTHGVEPETVKGYESVDSNLTADEMSNLRTHGVEPEYLKGVRESGRKLSIDEICELRTHGVEPGYLKAIQSADANLSAEEISELRTHGVEADYYREMKAAEPRLSIEEISNLRTHGVEPSYLKEMKSANPKIQIEEVTELRTHGVPASFAGQAARMGYRFSAEELSELWTRGVDEAYLRNLQDLGMKNLTSEQILKLRGR